MSSSRKAIQEVTNLGEDNAEGDRYSFLNAMTTEIDGVMRSVGDSISRNLYRDGSGAIGRVNN